MENIALLEEHPNCRERLMVVVSAVQKVHGFGCRACDKALPPNFAAVFVATSATPGVSGQLHFVCDRECGGKVLGTFREIGTFAELWPASRVREWLNHSELMAG